MQKALRGGSTEGRAYGRITYTEESHEANLGPLELTVKEKKTVEVPMWACLVAVAVGTAMLLVPKGKWGA
ncbi:MAG: hypothetical protein AMXMBFR4_29620 [Candidatus Hydrogenedentota bacterium]